MNGKKIPLAFFCRVIFVHKKMCYRVITNFLSSFRNRVVSADAEFTLKNSAKKIENKGKIRLLVILKLDTTILEISNFYFLKFPISISYNDELGLKKKFQKFDVKKGAV